MKVAKILPIIVLALAMASCNQPAGELVGIKGGNFKEANPYGMVFIKKGSFMMGANTQSAVFEQPDNIIMVTVEAEGRVDFSDTAEKIRQLFKSKMNVTPKVAVIALNTLPRSEKKTRRVFDHRQE